MTLFLKGKIAIITYFRSMLAAKNIQKQYGQLEILKGIDINIKKGEIISIVGPSGSGKSTLLHILGTLDEADEGNLEIDGVKISSKLKLELIPVAWWKRLLNLVIDWLFCGAILSSILYFALGYVPDFLENFDAFTLFFSQILSISFLYSFMFESLTGRTLAKYFTGTKVIMEKDGTRPNFRSCLFRSFARFFPFGLFEAFSYLNARPAGWHDDITNTLVVDSKVPYQKRSKDFFSGKKLAAFRNKHIGFVFQFHHLLPEFTALENVCIPGWIAGGKRKEVVTRAIELLKILGLADRMENKPQQLSGGEQQRVAVARALINNPSIVMADEPTGNLDSANAKELHQLFIDLRNRYNQTFLIVTHNEELAKMSDRTLIMKDGKMI